MPGQSSKRKTCSKEIWFNFHSVGSKCDHAKVILVSATPFEMLEKAAFGSLKTLFSPSRRISHHLRCGSLAFPVQLVAELSFFIQRVALSLFTAPWLAPWFLECTVQGQLLWSKARRVNVSFSVLYTCLESNTDTSFRIEAFNGCVNVAAL